MLQTPRRVAEPHARSASFRSGLRVLRVLAGSIQDSGRLDVGVECGGPAVATYQKAKP